jgi:hypothetical protein
MPDWRAYVNGHLPRLQVPPERETEIVAELALQLDQTYTEALAGGASEADALRRAEAQFADWRELGRHIDAAEARIAAQLEPSRGGMLAGWWHDLRYAGRFLRRNPGFTAIAAITLAFGIGGNTAVFTMVDAVALRSLPYRDPGQLMAIETRKAQQPELEPWTSGIGSCGYARAHNRVLGYRGDQPGVERCLNRSRRRAAAHGALRLGGFLPHLGSDAGRAAGSRPHLPAR